MQSKTEFRQKRYPNFRSISSIQKAPSLVIKIDPAGDRVPASIFLVIVCCVFVASIWSFLHLLMTKEGPPIGVLPFAIFILAWCYIGFNASLEALCVIELFAGKGVFRWTCRIWRWSRNMEALANEVTAIAVRNRWYGSRLSITFKGKTYTLGRLLEEDAATVANELRHAFPAASRNIS